MSLISNYIRSFFPEPTVPACVGTYEPMQDMAQMSTGVASIGLGILSGYCIYKAASEIGKKNPFKSFAYALGAIGSAYVAFQSGSYFYQWVAELSKSELCAEKWRSLRDAIIML